MKNKELFDILERSPVIAAVHNSFESALSAPPEILFHLKANIITLPEQIKKAHENNKFVFIHLDLAEGIGKDRAGIEFLKGISVDGIISTRSQIIRMAKEFGLATVQRCFVLDSQGTQSINDILETSSPDFIEIMPGVIGKVIERFSGGKIPVIAGGLIETKAEVTSALASGAVAVSTGKKELWYL